VAKILFKTSGLDLTIKMDSISKKAKNWDGKTEGRELLLEGI
jgi:hypothetical protein